MEQQTKFTHKGGLVHRGDPAPGSDMDLLAKWSDASDRLQIARQSVNDIAHELALIVCDYWRIKIGQTVVNKSSGRLVVVRKVAAGDDIAERPSLTVSFLNEDGRPSIKGVEIGRDWRAENDRVKPEDE